MSKVFISGSISMNQLSYKVLHSLDKIISKNFQVFVGDANGLDISVQNYLKIKNYTHVVVCTIYDTPRNIATSRFEVKTISYEKNLHSEREKQTFKDEYMTFNSEYSFIVWDGKSQGSYKNILRGLEQGKKTKVYYAKENRFLEKSELNEKTITALLKDNTGYTLTELVKAIKESNLFTTINKTSELKDWLIEHKILRKKEKKLEINTSFRDYFVVESFRGNETIKYKLDILNLIESNSIFGYGK